MAYTPLPTDAPEPSTRPPATWRCTDCKERMLVDIPPDPSDLRALHASRPPECEVCGAAQLRGPYFPIDVPYRLYEEAYRALANQGTTIRKRVLRILRDEIRHVLDDHGLTHGRCFRCMGLAIPWSADPAQFECLECGHLADVTIGPPVSPRLLTPS